MPPARVTPFTTVGAALDRALTESPLPRITVADTPERLDATCDRLRDTINAAEDAREGDA